MCVMAFSEDLAYWGIDEIYLETCCQNKFNLRKEYIEEEIKKELLNIKQEEPDIFPETKCGNYMRFIWDLMEKSETSFAARIVSFLSISFIIISTYELFTCFHEFCKYESTNFYLYLFTFLMSSSSQIRDVSNLEIVVELYLLFFSAEKIQIENSQSMPKKANKSFLL